MRKSEIEIRIELHPAVKLFGVVIPADQADRMVDQFEADLQDFGKEFGWNMHEMLRKARA